MFPNRLSWSENEKLPSLYDGWTIEVFDCGNSVDLSSFNYVWTGSAPFMCKKDISGESRVFGTGPDVWILLPNQEPHLRKENGAMRHHPPLVYVSKILDELYKYGFKVYSCNSEFGDKKIHQKVIIEYGLTNYNTQCNQTIG